MDAATAATRWCNKSKNTRENDHGNARETNTRGIKREGQAHPQIALGGITSDLLRKKKVATVLTCALVDKPSRREVPADPDFVGFTVPDVFIVGYGIDCAREYRQLPFIGMIE